MPATWSEVTSALGMRGASPYDARANIRAAGYYMRRMRGIWTSPRPEQIRRELAQASYNAGAGNIIRAQKICDNAPDWETISHCLQLVTGRHSTETITYVIRIRRWQGQLCNVERGAFK